MSGYRPLTFTEDGLVRTFQQMRQDIADLKRRGVPVINIPEQECCAPVQSVGAFWVDSRTGAGTASPVTLEAGQKYTLRITGNFCNETTQTFDVGTPDDVMWPSPGQGASAKGAIDYDTIYASYPTGGAIGHRASIPIDLGSGPQHIEPVGGPYSSPTNGHTYLVQVTGEGSPVTIGPLEAGTSTDNNGMLKVEVISGTTSGEGLLSGIGDVDTTTNPPSDGQGLVYDEDTGKWVPGEVVASGVSDLSSLVLADDAMHWTVSPHGGPQAVWDEETQRTWFAFLKAGGHLYASYYDHTTGDIATPQLVAAYPFATADFHHVPAVMLATDGRLHIILGGHDDGHRHYRMDNPRDLTAWTSQTLSDGTYPFACVTDDGELIFTDRAGDLHGSVFPVHEFGSIWRCTDGSTWTRSAIVDTTGTPEAQSDFYQGDILWAEGRVRLVWTVAAGATHDEPKTGVYYAAYDPATSTLYAADGTDLGSTITWADHTSCLVASVTSSDRVRLALEWHRGAPAIAYAASEDRELIVTVWDGTAWVEDAPILTDVGAKNARLKSTPDELILLAHGEVDDDGLQNIEQWRRIDGEWESAGLILRASATREFTVLTPVRDGPGLALALGYDQSSGFPGNDDTVVGDLAFITGPASTGASTTTEAADETIFAPSYAVTDGTNLDVAVTFVWGIDATGDPYYNAAGVTAGDEAVLVLDNTTGEFSLRPVEV